MRHEPTVFVVDDDSAIRDSLSWLVESVGLTTQTYDSATEFLTNCDFNLPGCLILDVRMPGKSGLDLQKMLIAKGVKLPIIFITGHGDILMAVRAMKQGAFDFIEKPFNHQALLERIQLAVGEDIENKMEQAEQALAVGNLARLTSRERQVMDLLLTGKPTKVIAADLQISCRTAEIYRGRVMEKMEATSLCDLMRKAILSGTYSTRTAMNEAH